jgi:amino acid adenylation domain-containing protein
MDQLTDPEQPGNAVAPFFAAAQHTPAAPALVDDAGQVTYGELARRVRTLSAALADRVGLETPVSVELGRGRDCLTAALAVLHRGGTAVFADPAARRHVPALGPGVVGLAARDITYSTEDPGDPVGALPGRAESPDPAPRPVHPGCLAYACHTSGSTGIPKWVGVPHAALINRIAWGQRTYPLGPDDRVLWQADPGFDFAVWEMLAPLWYGASVVVADGLRQVNLRDTAERIVRHGVTAAHFVPSVLRAFLRVADAAALAGLRYLFVGGEQFDADLLRRLQAHPLVRLFNQYGPTETCIDSTWFDASHFTGEPVVPIGAPIDGTTVVLLTPDGTANPDAAEGELGIAGVGLACGYLGDPRTTADRFVPSPVGPPGARLYRTGDVVRRRDDGSLEYVGRCDDQVKVNGIRVELEEVRAAVRAAYPAADVAVTAVADGERVRLVAFVAGDCGRQIAHAGGGRLADLLHPVKLPTLVAVPTIARTAAGKPDLPAMMADWLDDPAAGETAPDSASANITPTEAQIAKIWCELLQVPAVGPDDNFFALGGHSLMATELAAGIEESFSVEMPLRDVFDCDSLRELARVVDELAGKESGTMDAQDPNAIPDAALEPVTGAPGGVGATLFNASVSAFAVVSAAELGLLDEIAGAGHLDVAGYADQHDLHHGSVGAIVDALAAAGLLKVGGGIATPTASFPEVYATKGFFLWLLGGCGELLRTGGTVARNRNRTGRFIRRDAKTISIGTGDFGARFIDPVFEAAYAGHPYRCVADLGCGGGSRLIQALRANPEATAVGVDYAPAAVELARERLAAAGFANRAVVIEADVHYLPAHPAFADVDFLTSFLMGHDLWPRERCVTVLENFRTVFPAVRSFALCDTYRSEAVPSLDLPILTLGFEYVHRLMGQYIPTLAEWYEVFGSTCWRVDREHDLLLPPYSKIFHLVPAEA